MTIRCPFRVGECTSSVSFSVVLVSKATTACSITECTLLESIHLTTVSSDVTFLFSPEERVYDTTSSPSTDPTVACFCSSSIASGGRASKWSFNNCPASKMHRDHFRKPAGDSPRWL